jgi:DNA-binding MarR family transcriptional regulator
MAMGTPIWLSPAEMSAWRAYIVASRRLWEAFESDLGDHGLTMYDYELLAHLSEAPARTMRMSELAEIALLSRSRLSHRIKVMEKAGLVTREECAHDRRGLNAVMTEKGWKAIQKAAPDHVNSVRSHFIDLLSKEELDQFTNAFSRIQEHLRSSEDLCS